MKGLLSILLALILACAALPALGAEEEEDIAGTWRMTKFTVGEHTYTDPEAVGSRKIIVFSEDGSAVVTINRATYNARWQRAGDTIDLVYEDGDRAAFAVEEDRLIYATGEQVQYFSRQLIYAPETDFTHRPLAEGGARIIRYLGDNSVLNIPETLGGAPVRSIAVSAVAGKGRLVSAVLPAGLTHIEEWAFANCKSLTSVKLPDGLQVIGSNAFYQCKSLSRLRIPAKVTDIGPQAFMGCAALTEVTVPGSVKTVGMLAFADCEGLRSVAVEEGVEILADGAFSGCAQLTAVTLPASIREIHGNPFSGCAADLVISAPAGSYAVRWRRGETK